jgi:hypothetical protein
VVVAAAWTLGPALLPLVPVVMAVVVQVRLRLLLLLEL